MGKKIKNKCSYSSDSDSNTCCNKYPKCTPIYYPERNYLYPCQIPQSCPIYPPCPPCPPIRPNPCPIPFPPLYTANNIIGTTSTSLSVSSPTINVYNAPTDIIITLPPINTLSSVNYIKQFIISSHSLSIGTITPSPTSPDIIINGTITLAPGQTATIYSVYSSGGSFWVIQV